MTAGVNAISEMFRGSQSDAVQGRAGWLKSSAGAGGHTFCRCGQNQSKVVKLFAEVGEQAGLDSLSVGAGGNSHWTGGLVLLKEQAGFVNLSNFL